MAIKNKFIHFNTRAGFDNNMSDPTDTTHDFYNYTVFIKDTQEIYTHGQFYKCSEYDDTELRGLIDDNAVKFIEVKDFTLNLDSTGDAIGSFTLTDEDENILNNLGSTGKAVFVGTYVDSSTGTNRNCSFISNFISVSKFAVLPVPTYSTTSSIVVGDNKTVGMHLWYTTAQNVGCVYRIIKSNDIKTINGESIIGDGNINITSDLLTEITHSELIALKEAGELIPGMQYRITNYVATTSAANTQTASHPFDVIVVADSENTINEVARAIQHDGDTYFANSDLSKWELKYSLTGDTTKYGWAKPAAREAAWNTNWGPLVSDGTITIDGTTWYLYESSTDTARDYLSEYTFYRKQVIETVTSADQLMFVADSPIEWNDDEWYLTDGPSEVTVQTTSGNYIMTLYRDGDSYTDEQYEYWIYFTGSTQDGDQYVLTAENPEGLLEYGNLEATMEDVYDGALIKLYYGFTSPLTSGASPTINIVSTDTALVYTSDDWGDRITPVTEVTEEDATRGVIYYMKDEFGNECPYDFKGIMFKHPIAPTTYTGYYYTFSSTSSEDLSVTTKTCAGNKMGSYVSNGVQQINKNLFLGGAPVGNTIGFNSYNNTFGTDAIYNSIGSNSYGNRFGGTCNGNVLGAFCNSNTFGDGCNYNHIHNNSVSNEFGDKSQRNILHMYANSNTFGTTCNTNRLYNYCSNNTFGNNCVGNVLEDACNYNSFRMSASSSGTVRNYCSRNHLSKNCQYNVIYNAETASSTQMIEFVHIYSGVSGTSSSYNMINIDTLKPGYTINVAKNSSGEIKIYCEADLIA